MEESFLKIVTTFDGTKAIKSNCRHIKGKYYEMNRQCFNMPDGQWHRVNNGKIVKDIRKDVWVFKNHPNLVKGIVDVEEGNPKIGYFSKEEDDVTIQWNDGIYYNVLDESFLKSLNVIEDISTGHFVSKDLVKHQIVPGKNYIGTKKINSYPMSLNYNSDNSLDYFMLKHAIKGSKSKLDFFADEIEDITFGK